MRNVFACDIFYVCHVCGYMTCGAIQSEICLFAAGTECVNWVNKEEKLTIQRRAASVCVSDGRRPQYDFIYMYTNGSIQKDSEARRAIYKILCDGAKDKIGHKCVCHAHVA